MVYIAIILLITNIIGMIILYRKVRFNFSQNAYKENLKDQVTLMIGAITLESDQAVTLIEDKIEQIEKLIDEADKRILMAENAEKKRIDEQQILEDFNSTKASVKDEKKRLSKKGKKGALGAQPELVSLEEKKIEPITIYTKPQIKRTDVIIPGAIPPKEMIIEMAQQGLSIELIAEKINIPRGEIELIISMNT